MSNKDAHIDDELIARYLSGEAAEEEQLQVKSWVKLSEANRRHFERLRVLWERTGRIASHEEADVDVDRAWKRFQATARKRSVSDKKGAETRSLFGYWARIAAVLVVGLSIWFIVRNIPGDVAEMQVLATSEAVETDSLPDGSIVTVNRGGRVTYPETFSGDRRVVTLQGEAFFQVAANPDKPFVVQANTAEVTVLGTSFYVQAYDSAGMVDIGVEEGKVSVTSKGVLAVLQAGERVIINTRSGELTAKKAYDPNVLFWKSETLTFRDVPLQEVFDVLESAYGVDIEVRDQDIIRCRLSARFDKAPVEQVLQIIGTNFGIATEKQGDVFIVSGNGCE